MSDEGKIENEIINYSVSRGNKYNQPGNERTALMDDDSGFRRAIKVGNRNCSHLLQLVQRNTVTQILLQILTKISHLQKLSLTNFYFNFQPCTKFTELSTQQTYRKM